MRKHDTDEFDPITVAPDGSVIWRRYGDGKTVTARPGETPQQALEREEREGTEGA